MALPPRPIRRNLCGKHAAILRQQLMKCFTLAVRTTHRRTKACEFDATIVVYVHRWPCRRFEDERYTVPLAISPEPENWRTVLEHAIRFEHARGPPAC